MCCNVSDVFNYCNGICFRVSNEKHIGSSLVIWIYNCKLFYISIEKKRKWINEWMNKFFRIIETFICIGWGINSIHSTVPVLGLCGSDTHRYSPNIGHGINFSINWSFSASKKDKREDLDSFLIINRIKSIHFFL